MFMRYYLDELPCRHIHGKKEDIHSSKDHVGHECTIIYFVAFICEKNTLCKCKCSTSVFNGAHRLC